MKKYEVTTPGYEEDNVDVIEATDFFTDPTDGSITFIKELEVVAIFKRYQKVILID